MTDVNLFQPTRPRGARHPKISLVYGLTVRFNPRAREGRDFISCLFPKPTQCFNPRAREGRDHKICNNCGHKIVSTHAPARGATAGLLPVII